MERRSILTLIGLTVLSLGLAQGQTLTLYSGRGRAWWSPW
jgi:iron(III) transport system substrate-binding protein